MRDDYDIPDDWYHDEREMFLELLSGEHGAIDDEHLQALFDDALFDPDVSPMERQSAYDELIDYLWEEYGIDFEDAFDWEDYREWYDAS